MKTLKNYIYWTDYPILSNFSAVCVLLGNIRALNESISFSEYSDSFKVAVINAVMSLRLWVCVHNWGQENKLAHIFKDYSKRKRAIIK